MITPQEKLEMRCRSLALARVRMECLRALTIIDAPHLSVAAWSHRSFAIGQAYDWFHGAVWDVHDLKRQISTMEELYRLGFFKQEKEAA